MSAFWSAVVRGLKPYVPGEQPRGSDLTKLNTNENPYGPSPKVIAAIKQAASDRLRLYPDPNADALRDTIAQQHGLTRDQVFVGNGSDEVLAHVFLALLKHDLPILFPDISYSFYPVYCQLYDIAYQTIAVDDGLQIQLDDYACDNGGIIFPNPNAPTGQLLACAEIAQLCLRHPRSVIVVDEAYIDFGGESMIPWVQAHPNLLVTQSLSKSRSLAGMRLGFAVGQAPLIEALFRVKDSFNSYPVDSLALAAGIAAFEDRAYFEQTCQAVIAARAVVTRGLQELGFTVLPSAANFVFARHPTMDAAQLSAGLRKAGVIVRHFAKPRIDQYLRISIGTPEENQLMLSVMDTLV